MATVAEVLVPVPYPVMRRLAHGTACLLFAAMTGEAQESGGFGDAQSLLYNAHYPEAVALASRLTPSDPDEVLAIDELKSTAILFQLRPRIEARKNQKPAEVLKQCEECRTLLTAFYEVNRQGQARARARVKDNPDDMVALFFLAKMDLNYLWLELGTLGKRTGWDEFFEARKALTRLLTTDPQHVRGRVARAWMEYIVDTKLPWGTEWIFGGGDKKKALVNVREAAASPSEFYTQAEAEFALWEMLKRESHRQEATSVAVRLAERFPGNLEVSRYLEGNPSAAVQQ